MSNEQEDDDDEKESHDGLSQGEFRINHADLLS